MGFSVKPNATTSNFKSNRYWLGFIIFVAVVLRLAAAFLLGNEVENTPGTFDQISYNMLAQRVLEGQGFTVAEDWWPATRAGEPTAHWSYSYTLFLVAIYSVFGSYPLLARVLQAILAGILLPWLVYRVGYQYFNHRIGLISAGLAAIYIYFVYYAAALMTETFYLIAILWVLDIAGQLGHTPDESASPRSKFQWIWLGIALGATVLLRQVFLLFIPVLFIWLLWRGVRYQIRPVWYTMIGLTIAGTILVLTIVPWTYRNYQAFDELVLLNTNAGFAFFWGNHPIHGYNFISILPDDAPSYYELIPPELLSLSEAQLDRALLQRAFGFIGENPVRYLILSFSRLKDYFKFWPSAESSLISNLSRLLSFGLFLPFMLYGLISSIRRPASSKLMILYLFIVIYTGVHLLSWALIRYRLPVDVVLILFASVAILDLQARFVRYQTTVQDTPSPPSFSFGE